MDGGGAFGEWERPFFMRSLLYIVLGVFFLGTVGPVLAVTISPAKIEVSADPGQTVVNEIDLFNEQDTTKTFFSSVENFEASGDSGAPRFIGASGGLATWIQTVNSVTVTPGQRVQVPYTINIPSSAKPGGYFAAIFFGDSPPEASGGGTVSIGSKIGVLVLLRVNGDIEEKAGLNDLSIKDGTRILSTIPVQFEYTFSNQGGDRIVPRGEINIKNTFRFTSAKLFANERAGSVLPGSTRRLSVVWGDESYLREENKTGFFGTAWRQVKDFHFGWYTAKINLTWGETNIETASDAYHFFIIPWQLLLLVSAITLLFWFVGWKGLAQYKRRIIAQVTRNQ